MESEFPASVSPAASAPDKKQPTRSVAAGEVFPDLSRESAPSSSPAASSAPTSSPLPIPFPSASGVTPRAQPTPAVLAARAAAPPSAAIAMTRRPSVSPKRGMPVTLLIPRALLKGDDDRASRRGSVWLADVTAIDRNAAAVNGRSDWMQAGLPSMLEASVGKITAKKDYTDVELQTTGPQGPGAIVTLRFSGLVPDPEATLGQLILEGGGDTAAARVYRAEAHASVADAVFSGELKSLPQPRKLSILSTLQDTPGAPDVHVQNGGVYASFDLGGDVREFDARSSDVETIVAYVLRETLLPEMRKMAKTLTSVPELRGMRVVYRIPHEGKSRAIEDQYQLEVIAGMSDVLAFAAGELSSEALIDGATISVDGKNVDVNLASSAKRAAR
jgi:hypothetical protein